MYVSDHHPVFLTLRVPLDGVPRPCSWRVGGRIHHDFNARVFLRQHLLLTATPLVATLTDWDCLKQQ